MKTMKIWRIIFMMLAALSLASCIGGICLRIIDNLSSTNPCTAARQSLRHGTSGNWTIAPCHGKWQTVLTSSTISSVLHIRGKEDERHSRGGTWGIQNP